MERFKEYKPTGIKWLPEIPVNWVVKRLKYVADININSLPETTDEEYTFRYLDIGNVTLGNINYEVESITFKEAPSRARRIVQQGDILISTVRTYLKAIAQIEQDATDIIASTGFAVLSARNVVDKRFLFYISVSEKFVDTISALSTGVSYPATTAAELGNIPVWFPQSLSEQRTIANYLDAKTTQINQLITQKQQMMALLQEEWVALINHAVTKGLDADTPMRDSGIEWLGQVPAHWEVASISRLCNMGRGRVINHEYINDNPGIYPVYSSQTANNGVMGLINTYDFDGEFVTWTTDGANAGTVSYREGKFNCTNVCGTLSAKSANVHLKFLPYILNLGTKYSVRFDINPKLMNGMMGKIMICVPPVEEQHLIVQFLDAKSTEVNLATNFIDDEIALLQEYRAALIVGAITGQIDLRNYGPASISTAELFG